MTITEGLTILGCLALGYWIVAVFVPTLTKKSSKDSAEESDTSSAGEREYSQGADTESNKSNSGPQTHDENASSALWHEVLEISEFSSKEEIAAAYKRKIRQYHPDKVSQMGKEIRDLAESKAKQINAAYVYAIKLREI